MSVWRPGGKARISVSALLRIQRDDGCFAVIKNLHRPEDYSAIGGVYKCHPKSGPLELDAFGFIPENRMQGEDVTNDVRGYTRRKFIGKIRSEERRVGKACVSTCCSWGGASR